MGKPSLAGMFLVLSGFQQRGNWVSAEASCVCEVEMVPGTGEGGAWSHIMTSCDGDSRLESRLLGNVAW